MRMCQQRLQCEVRQLGVSQLASELWRLGFELKTYMLLRAFEQALQIT